MSSEDEEVEARLDASSQFHFNASLENEEVKIGFDVSSELISEFRGDTLFLSHTHTLSLSHTHIEHEKKKKWNLADSMRDSLFTFCGICLYFLRIPLKHYIFLIFFKKSIFTNYSTKIPYTKNIRRICHPQNK